MPPRKRLGQLLTELHVVDEHQLQSALGHQKQWGGKLGAILVQKGFCREAQVVSALATHLGMPVVRLATQKVDPRAVKLVTRPIAEKLHVFAYEILGSGRGEVLTVAMSDPTDLSAVDQLAFHTGKRIKPMLCGDSEIVNAIVTSYGETQPAPAVAGAAPAKPAVATTTPAPGAAAPSATTAFPRRIEPNQPPAPHRASSPYIPPPIPARSTRPVQPLEEIEPVDADSFVNVAAAQPATQPEPLELAESDGAADGPMEGLEPIAAHVQSSGEEVTGQEDVAGDGTAGDALEGLEDASDATRHEGVEDAPLEGLERSDAAPADASWHSAPQTTGSEWGVAPEGGWDAAPTGEAEPADEAARLAISGWGESAPAAPPRDSQEGQDWGATPDAPEAAWETAQPAWGAGEQAETEPVAAAEEPLSEELPADAIIGTADVLEGGDESWAAPPEETVPQAAPAHDEHAHDEPAHDEPAHDEHAHDEPAHDEQTAAQEPVAYEGRSLVEEQPSPGATAPEEHGSAVGRAETAPEHGGAEHEAFAPDAWATSEDPLAAREHNATVTAWGEPAQEPQAEVEQAWTAPAETGSVQEPEAEVEAELELGQEAEHLETVDPAAGWPEEVAGGHPSHEPIAADEEAALGEQEFATESPPAEARLAEPHLVEANSPFEEQAPAPEAFAVSDSDADDVPASETGAGEESAPALSGSDPSLAQEIALPETSVAHHEGEDQGFPGGDEPHRHADADGDPVKESPAHDAATAEQPSADVPIDERLPEELPANDGQAEAGAVEESAAFQDEPTEEEQSAAEDGSEEPLLEGWIAPPPEPPAVGAGWLGEALAATMPLSPADLETLSTVGVDMNDGVGAFRLLAAVLRVLQRRNVIDFEELAGELMRSRGAIPDAGPAEQLTSEEAL